MRETKIDTSSIKGDIADFNDFRKANFGKLRLTNSVIAIDSFYQELSNTYPEYFDSNITNPSDQLQAIAEWRNETVKDLLKPTTYTLTNEDLSDIAHYIVDGMQTLNDTIKILNESSQESSFSL